MEFTNETPLNLSKASPEQVADYILERRDEISKKDLVFLLFTWKVS